MYLKVKKRFFSTLPYTMNFEQFTVRDYMFIYPSKILGKF